VNHETQVGHDQFTRSIKIFVIIETTCQRLFVFLAQYRDGTYRMDIRIKAADRTCQSDIVG
jgi:hypothetical protein